ncbi:MAG TPA: SelL-related redox protein [Chitinophagales bacterium]|nr:redoxin domain-containing protein [Chitinophagales bacterium]HAE13924.1 hypothetical protein [Bacteroidota bacterium]HAE34330.1 hypothetical protein [Bacteroidota bacterium]HPE97744.1 SelL-related redox protein [Chitinophagales bacterium]HPR28425.1 SelL-related redox protein [Chitinophagales bacterium]
MIMVDFTRLKNRLNAWLFIAAVYFIIWSALVLIFPQAMHSIVVETSQTNLVFWDLIAIVTIILGLGLLVAAFDPFRNWLIMFLNLLFHVGIIVGFVVGWFNGIFTSNFLPFLFFNHFIWLIPLVTGIYLVYKRGYQADKILIETFNESDFPLELFETVSGKNLQELSEEQPVLLVFLRHFGCPFCQETLLDVRSRRAELEAKGFTIVLVYMVSPAIGQEYLEQYGMDDMEQLSDPESIAYKRFRLNRGNFRQLLGPKVLYRWAWLGVKKRIFFTRVAGDINQMPGLFLLRNGQVVRQYVHRTSADKPDYSIFLSYSE